MLLAKLQPHFDTLMHQISDLMAESDAWGATEQMHVHAFWLYLDHMMLLAPQPQLPLFESRQFLNGLWCEFEALVNDPSIASRLLLIRKALIQISYLIDEHLSHRFEFPASPITHRSAS
jgi:hypothetical protein